MTLRLISETEKDQINGAFPSRLTITSYKENNWWIDDGIIAYLDVDGDAIFQSLFSKNMQEFLDEKPSYADIRPKVYGLMDVGVIDKHFHYVNYNMELSVSLYPKRVMVQGEVTQVDWYTDVELTDKVINVGIVYIRDGNGFAVSRTTTRTWINGDGSPNTDTKITYKDYTINSIEQINEGQRRRGNIVSGIQIPTMGLMMEALMPPPESKTQLEIIMMGREFMDRFEEEFNKFIDNSSTITDSQNPNFGKKSVVVAFENAADSWLDSTPPSAGGATIRQYLIAQFSI